jgi:serine phosphatase RsbU (regulator of sigma subunit)
VARQVGEHGTILGVIDPIDIHETRAELHAGETLLLYTDGVPEAGRPTQQLGEQGLLELCRSAPERTLAGLLEHVEQAALERAAGSLRDDIALLAIRLSESLASTPAANAPQVRGGERDRVARKRVR